MTVLKIAITGKMRAGKDSVAMRLFFDHGFEYPIAFGTTLKQTAEQLFPDYTSTGAKPRELYQRFGQLCREIDPDVWVKHAARSVEYALDSRKTKGVVISDLRQPNEYEWARANGFTIVRVNASDGIRRQRAERAGDIFDDKDFGHDTESYVDSFEVDYEIDNNGDIDDLTEKVSELVAEITS